MSFVTEFNSLPLDSLWRRCLSTTTVVTREILGKPHLSLSDFASLISPAASELLESLSRRSQQLTQQRFGKVIRLFAPLYLSNECLNNCKYCGFSRDNPILRVTLNPAEVLREARALKKQGFRNILLVSGEHPKFASTGYLADCVRALHEEIPSISLEVGPMSDRELVQLVCAFRLMFPDVGLVLSTREPAQLRDGLIPLGITLISAGSHTEPGGYTGAGKENIHHTKRGHIVDLAANSSEWVPIDRRATNATGQFDIADDRTPQAVADVIRRLGYEPVWKDWDAALMAGTSNRRQMTSAHDC